MPYNPQGGVWNPQGGAVSTLQASSGSGLRVQPAPTNSASLLQPTVAPTRGQNLVRPAGRASAAVAPSGGGVASAGGGGGATAAQIAAQQQAQEVAGLRNEITARRQRANSIFDALTGAVQALAQEKRGQLEGQYQQEQGRATEDFTDRGDELQRVYAARGLADSSYRIDAVDKAGRDYKRSIEDLGSQRQSGLAKVGGEAATSLARIGADKGAVNAQNLGELGKREDGTYDPNALRSLRNELDQRIRDAEVQQAQFGTEAGFRGKLDQIAPYNGTVDALKSALRGLIQSATPTVVKDKLAGAIISNYAPGDSKVWQEFYDKEKQASTSPTSVA